MRKRKAVGTNGNRAKPYLGSDLAKPHLPNHKGELNVKRVERKEKFNAAE